MNKNEIFHIFMDFFLAHLSLSGHNFWTVWPIWSRKKRMDAPWKTLHFGHRFFMNPSKTRKKKKEVHPVWGIRISSSKERGVKKASPVAPIMLGLEMCALPWGILIQACLTQCQVRVRMSQKKCPKWPFLAFFGLKPILNLEISLEISHTHVLEPN